MRIGEPQTFIRLQGCTIGCRWCDTPESFKRWPSFRVESPPGSRSFQDHPNPVSVDEIARLLELFPHRTLSLTGGEPLEQIPFLKTLLPHLTSRHTLLLETAGIDHEALAQILEDIDIISMDLKLPSSTKLRPYWREHEAFLKLANRKEVYCKAVVTPDTDDDDIRRASHLIRSVNREIPLVLQPVSNQFLRVPLQRFSNIAMDSLPNVRVLPQLHKLLGLP